PDTQPDDLPADEQVQRSSADAPLQELGRGPARAAQIRRRRRAGRGICRCPGDDPELCGREKRSSGYVAFPPNTGNLGGDTRYVFGHAGHADGVTGHLSGNLWNVSANDGGNLESDTFTGPSGVRAAYDSGGAGVRPQQ